MKDKNLTPLIGGGGKRLDYNDLAKALGMLTIMWGHIRLGDWSNSFVYAWHIPLFFFLSGMVFKKEKYADFKIFISKKVKSLLIPYAIFSLLTWIVWAAFAYVTHSSVESYWMPLAETVIAQGSGGFLVHNVPLWFVTCLFVMEVMYYFIASIKKAGIVIVTIGMAVISYCMITYFDGWDVTLLPWNIEVACLGLPIYAAGHLVVQKWGHQQMQDWVRGHKGMSLLLAIVFATIVMVGSHFNGSISFGHAELHNPLIAYACSFMGVAMMLIICMLLASTKACTENVKWMQWLKWFGRNSFTGMAIHNPIKGFACVIVGELMHCGSGAVSKNNLYSFFALIITLIATIAGIIVWNWLKRKLVKK